MMFRSLSSGDPLLTLGMLAWMDTQWNAARKEVSLLNLYKKVCEQYLSPRLIRATQDIKLGSKFGI